jgi:hypothetical protein
MSDAVIALIGVVIGGAAADGRIHERRRENRCGQSAARLVHAALTDADSFIKASLVRRAWLGDPLEALSDASWVEHRVAIAEAPGFAGWYPMAGAWAWIIQLRRLVKLFDEQVADDPLKNREKDFYELGLMLLGIADQALLRYAKTESYPDDSDEFQQELDAIFEAASKNDKS